MYFFYDNFVCDEINISFEEFREELRNKIYQYPIRLENQWNIEKKINYLNFLKNGYPDMGIIVDIKENGQRIVLDGIERCRAIDELGEKFIGNINKKIRIFELRGSNRKKMDFLRYYNFNGRNKSEAELRELIYSEYIEYKVLEDIKEIFEIISKDVTIDFLLKILSKITIREILEENDLIEEYLEKNMNTIDRSDLRITSRFLLNSIIVNYNFSLTNMNTLVSFLLDKLKRYGVDEINEYFDNIQLTKSLKKIIRELDIVSSKNSSNVLEYRKQIDKILKESNELIEMLKKGNKIINISTQSIEKDFYKYVKINKRNVREEI